MASPRYRFSAHHRYWSSSGELEELLQAPLKIFSQHVVCVAAKARIAPGLVGRALPDALAQTAEARQVSVMDSCLPQRIAQLGAVELRIPAGSGEGPDVRERFDAVQLKQLDEIPLLTRRVPNRKDPRLLVARRFLPWLTLFRP